MTYIAEPIQRTELRSLAKVIRKILQVEDRLYIPVITILENVMPMLFPNFMSDGSRISFRKKSTSDGTPVVEINITKSTHTGGVKYQKIHFIKEDDEQ